MSKLIESDYKSARIRTALYREGNKRHLIFASIELCPNELHLPKECEANQFIIQNSSSRVFELNTFHIADIAEAINWFNGKAENLLPNYLKFEDLDFLTEPPEFPKLSYSRAKCSFAPHWANDPRISRKIPLEEPVNSITNLADEIRTAKSVEAETLMESQKNLLDAQTGLTQFLGFDPFTNVDFLQNKVLLAPNPVFRSFFWNPIKNENDEEIDIFVSIEPRERVEQPDLHIRLFEHRNGSITNATTKLLSSLETSFLWKIGREVSQVSWEVICERRGLISKSEPHGLIRQFISTINPITQVNSIEIPKGGRRKPEQIVTTQSHGKPIISKVGSGTDPESPLLRLTPREKQRDIHINGNLQNQFLLDKGQTAAQNTLRALINKAKSELIIVDPYFGYRELGIYGYANEQYGVTPKILTGSQFLKDDFIHPADNNSEGEWCYILPRMSRGDRLNQAVATNHSQLPINIKVMSGEGTSIHDRFLVIDNDVWMLGPSLNEVGERLGVLVKLHKPSELVERLVEIWDNCPSLSEWLND